MPIRRGRNAPVTLGYSVMLYVWLDFFMFWNWNYLESSRMFYCSKDYMQEWSMHGTHGTANEEA